MQNTKIEEQDKNGMMLSLKKERRDIALKIKN
jgi:hypothetical protein